jgi:hypothetical protein
MDIFSDQGVAHAQTILRTQGRIRYLSDWEKDLSGAIKAAVIRPGSEPTILRPDPATGTPTTYALRVTRHGASRGRTFDYDRLQKDEPVLFHRNVLLTPPEKPLVLTFRTASRSQRAWNDFRSEGWQAAAELYQDRRERSLGNLQVTAEELSSVRASIKRLEDEEDEARTDMAAMILQQSEGAPPSVASFHGCSLNIRRTQPRRSIDLDLAERRSELRPFIKYYDKKSFTKVWFQKVEED